MHINIPLLAEAGTGRHSKWITRRMIFAYTFCTLAFVTSSEGGAAQSCVNRMNINEVSFVYPCGSTVDFAIFSVVNPDGKSVWGLHYSIPGESNVTIGKSPDDTALSTGNFDSATAHDSYYDVDAAKEEIKSILWSMVILGVKCCAIVCLTIFFCILMLVYRLLNHLFGCCYCFDGLEPLPPLEIGNPVVWTRFPLKFSLRSLVVDMEVTVRIITIRRGSWQFRLYWVPMPSFAFNSRSRYGFHNNGGLEIYPYDDEEEDDYDEGYDEEDDS